MLGKTKITGSFRGIGADNMMILCHLFYFPFSNSPAKKQDVSETLRPPKHLSSLHIKKRKTAKCEDKWLAKTAEQNHLPKKTIVHFVVWVC